MKLDQWRIVLGDGLVKAVYCNGLPIQAQHLEIKADPSLLSATITIKAYKPIFVVEPDL
jgi:hypothetical protein